MRLAISAFAIGELERVEHAHRLGDRQVDVLGDRPTLDADGAALRLQPLAAAGRARPQRAVGLEVFLFEPGPFLVAAAEVGDQSFEARAERIGLFRSGALAFRFAFGPSIGGRRPVEQQIADLLRQPPERDGQIDAERPPERVQRFADQLPVALGPRRDRAVLERERLVRHQTGRIEVVDRAEALAVRAGAVRRVERERPRRHLRHADAAIGAGQPAREQPIAAVRAC